MSLTILRRIAVTVIICWSKMAVFRTFQICHRVRRKTSRCTEGGKLREVPISQGERQSVSLGAIPRVAQTSWPRGKVKKMCSMVSSSVVQCSQLEEISSAVYPAMVEQPREEANFCGQSCSPNPMSVRVWCQLLVNGARDVKSTKRFSWCGEHPASIRISCEGDRSETVLKGPFLFHCLTCEPRPEMVCEAGGESGANQGIRSGAVREQGQESAR